MCILCLRIRFGGIFGYLNGWINIIHTLGAPLSLPSAAAITSLLHHKHLPNNWMKLWILEMWHHLAAWWFLCTKLLACSSAVMKSKGKQLKSRRKKTPHWGSRWCLLVTILRCIRKQVLHFCVVPRTKVKLPPVVSISLSMHMNWSV